jgi:beta-lactamase class A
MKNLIFPILIGSILLNIFLGMRFFQSRTAKAPVPADSAKEQSPDNFPYLSKRIFIENQNDLLINFIPLRSALQEYIVGLPDEVSVYFEYLPSGVSIGTNEHLEFRLASLVKTPLVMGIYKEIESGTMTKDTVLTVQKEQLDPKYGDLWKRGEGAKLTVKEAIDLALIKSDNTAANTLAAALPALAIDKVFDNLDIETDQQGEVPLITPQNYSSIFRSLYLASTVNKESSNEILEILTKTDFNDQIVAGVPKNIPVAHKIGVYTSENTRSDCGIIYVPQRPYLLCIMTKAEKEQADEYMTRISKMIYGYITVTGK